MRLSYELRPSWPRLAWVAEADASRDAVRVLHGPWVETHDSWFCDAAWDGAFAAGDFDRAPIVAGSGARLRDGRLVFVASSSNLDRLHRFRSETGVLVSNSLAALMSVLGAAPEYVQPDYHEVFANYRFVYLTDRVHRLETTKGPVELAYASDIVWNGRESAFADKALDQATFDTFETYRSYLLAKLQALATNSSDPARARPYRLVCPLSQGYDSTAVTALASQVAPVEAFTIRTDRDGVDDSGVEIARHLGVPCHVVERNAWRHAELPEVPFLSCSGSIGDLPFMGAEAHIEGALVLTGLGGEIVWNRSKKRRRPVSLGDGDQLGLMEYRLWAGFLVFPVPLIGIEQLVSLRRIAYSASMDPWHIREDYTRPTARRIVEEAGVPRGSFAATSRKSGLSETPLRPEFLLRESWNDFFAWLSLRRSEGARSLPDPTMAKWMDRALLPVARSVQKLERAVRSGPLERFGLLNRGLAKARKTLRKPYYHHRYLTVWALERAMERYAAAGSPERSSEAAAEPAHLADIK